MKKLCCSIAAIMATAAAIAQAPSARRLIVKNNTACTQYFLVFGGDMCSCTGLYSSSIQQISAGQTLPFLTTSIGGSYPTTVYKGIVGVKIFDGPTTCSPSAGIIGSASCGYTSTYTFKTLNPATCNPCGMTTASWIPATNCDMDATLIFNP